MLTYLFYITNYGKISFEIFSLFCVKCWKNKNKIRNARERELAFFYF